MQIRSFKKEFSRSLADMGETLHFAAHSHHLWPNVTREAHLQCWDDAARLNDKKWGHIFGSVIPETQAHIANTLSLPAPEQIAFGPNIHSFFLRLLSCLPIDRPPRILSTDGEFHSFSRQVKRLVEDGLIDLDTIPCDPFESLHERICDAITKTHYDLVYLSQVFFDSGRELQGLEDIVGSVRDDDTIIAIDGYHAFCALPTDLSAISDRVFYLAGGYKYAMSGEGCCFMAVPRGCDLRPRDTGWYASFATLSAESDRVAYANDGWRFAGATLDPSGVYRMNAVFDWMNRAGLTVDAIHQRIEALQHHFFDRIDQRQPPTIDAGTLIYLAGVRHGHFLTYDLGSPAAAQTMTHSLEAANVRIDSRGSRVRFGFGLYHTPEDVDALADRLKAIPAQAVPVWNP